MSDDPKISARSRRSKSEHPLRAGLYLVATPIGNSRDITLRALDVLASVDRLYAEDTRVTAKLLAMHAIARPMHSYREQNARTADAQIKREIDAGQSVAVVSDAGSPLISDPGHSLVATIAETGGLVFPVPGPSAAIAALIASGLPSDRFFFAGFLPNRSNERRRAIRELEGIPGTLIFYEAPTRLAETITDLAAVLGNRDAVVARELTKMHEEFVRSPLDALIEHYERHPDVKGEIVILVAPPGAQAKVTDENEIDRRLMEQLKSHPVKDAAAIVAADLGLARRVVYARALSLKKSNEG
ncbi:MAG: 16S rRNA (cytidine(1402)-2'-O)-methyltransferase [Micropepsaceae bacterium]